jgi:hypothetical protein
MSVVNVTSRLLVTRCWIAMRAGILSVVCSQSGIDLQLRHADRFGYFPACLAANMPAVMPARSSGWDSGSPSLTATIFSRVI